ncbi:MAG TPA: response regulator [Nitrososphaeraceae archaeon]|nr:response regulator [Nitrososphaeraceae archaeon]
MILDRLIDHIDTYSITKEALTSSPDQYKGRILLVDDDVDITHSFSLALQKDGFIVDMYNDPLIALGDFKADLYDLVLLDIKLPKMDGFELYDKIREIDRRVKVCFISGYQMNYLALREQGLQIDCFISKPIKIEDLLRRINAELA